ncbi:hypothetical protein OC834_000034 [Tilletia horrida]|nr:hypothetical protein OC834_000034 [Tilletia horrida]
MITQYARVRKSRVASGGRRAAAPRSDPYAGQVDAGGRRTTSTDELVTRHGGEQGAPMHATRSARGVRRIFPFLRDVAPATLKPVPASRLAGLTLAIDATLVGTRFHFADDPHPARHLFGFYRLIRSLRALDARAIMVFDHPLGGNRARNPAKLQEAERRRTQRALVAKRAELEQQRFARIKMLSQASSQLKRMSEADQELVYQQLRAMALRVLQEREVRTRMQDRSEDVGEVDEAELAAGPFEELQGVADPPSHDDAIQAPEDTPEDAKPEPQDEGWDEHIGNPIWEELIEDVKMAAAFLAATSAALDDVSAGAAEAANAMAQADVPANIAALVAQLHDARQQFERLHPEVAIDYRLGTLTLNTASGSVESKSQVALTAAEARIHATMLHQRFSDSVSALPEQASLVDSDEAIENEGGNEDEAEMEHEDDMETEVEKQASAAVPPVLQSDLLSDGEDRSSLEAKRPVEQDSSSAMPGSIAERLPLGGYQEIKYDVEVNAIHTQSGALSKSYHRASTPLLPQTIIDCAHLCALMGVPVLFTSRGSASAGTSSQRTEDSDTGDQLTIPGAAWAGHARLRSRAHEAEALAASLVHAGFADIVASEDSDVLMYDVPMLRGLLGSGGSGALKGMVWVDAKHVRRTLFAGLDQDAEELEEENSSEVTESLPGADKGVVGGFVDVEENLLASEDPEATDLVEDDATSEQALGGMTSTPKKVKVLTADERNRRRFHDFALLLGTDFNRTIPGVGPKIAYSLVKEHGDIPTILRLKKAPPAASKSKAQSKATPVPPPATTPTRSEYKFSPPPPLSRREFLLELSRARAVFNHPPTLYGNLARLRRWAAGGDYFDWKGSVASSVDSSQLNGSRVGSEATIKTSDRQREEDRWRRREISRLFQQHGVHRLPVEAGTDEAGEDGQHKSGFGAALEDFLDEIGTRASQVARSFHDSTGASPAEEDAHGKQGTAQEPQISIAPTDGTHFDSTSSNPFGTDLFGEKETPSGELASALLTKTARSARSASRKRAGEGTTSQEPSPATRKATRTRTRRAAAGAGPMGLAPAGSARSSVDLEA